MKNEEIRRGISKERDHPSLDEGITLTNRVPKVLEVFVW